MSQGQFYQMLSRNPAALHRSRCWFRFPSRGPGLLLSVGNHRVTFFLNLFLVIGEDDLVFKEIH